MAKATGPKKTAWDAFAQWVRVRDCIATSGFPFTGDCITCGRRFHIRTLEAGHMTPGRSNGVLFQEELVRAQCYRCNQLFHGKAKKFRTVMVAEYTEKKVAEWEREGRKPIKDIDMDFPAITQEYRAKIKELLKPFGYNTYQEMLNGHQF